MRPEKQLDENRGVQEVLDRLARALGTRTDVALASALGVSPQAIANSKKRSSIPYERICAVADEKGLSLDYILLGNGQPEYSGRTIDAELMESVFKALTADYSEFRDLAPLDFARVAFFVYDGAAGFSDAESRGREAVNVVRRLSLLSLKEAEQRDAGNVELRQKYPEIANAGLSILRERIAKLEKSDQTTGAGDVDKEKESPGHPK